jgi:hypothetical protein
MSDERWYYFLSIEKDFIRTLDFVHIHPNNAHSFSNEYAKLLLLIGSEVDVVAKMLCSKEAPTQSAKNIVDYRTILMGRFNGIHTVEIELTKYKLKIQPWLSWGAVTPTSPAWWTAHNNVKHERDKNVSDANQENTVHALCGLMALLLYWFKDDPHLQPYPELLNYDFPAFLVDSGGKKPPGV